MQRRRTISFAITCCALLVSCHDSSSALIPATALGRFATEWLSAHNRGDTHSIVHFTVTHGGSLRMTSLQEDSAVHAAVQFARDTGPLVAVKLLHSSDTALSVLLCSRSADTLRVLFKPASQPSLTQVVVQIDRRPAARGDR